MQEDVGCMGVVGSLPYRALLQQRECGEQWGHLQGKVVVGMGGGWWECGGESDTVTSEAEEMLRQGPSGQ